MELAQRENMKGKRATRGKSTLARKMEQLYDLYKPCPTKFNANEQAELNKKHRTPSLSYQLSGQRIQDTVLFEFELRNKSPCAVCTHGYTMHLNNAHANATNAARQKQAQADNEKTFEGVSAKVGCYCFRLDCNGALDGKGCFKCMELYDKGVVPQCMEQGYCGFLDCDICKHNKEDRGCQCQVIFDEHNRQKIALLSLHKQKLQNEKKSKTDSTAATRPEGTAASLFYNTLNEQ
jgi:hypothetical protein